MADVDVLGVEFNHDVTLQRNSGRAPYLIARNLGDRGHLSNAQGAGLVSAVLGRSAPGSVRHVVLLHLSDQCNRPSLALKEARGAVRAAGRRVAVHAARQSEAYPNLQVRPVRRRRRSPTRAVPLGSGLTRAGAARSRPSKVPRRAGLLPQRRPPPARPARSGRRLARLVDRLGPEDSLTIVGDLCDFWYAARQHRADPMDCAGLAAAGLVPRSRGSDHDPGRQPRRLARPVLRADPRGPVRARTSLEVERPGAPALPRPRPPPGGPHPLEGGPQEPGLPRGLPPGPRPDGRRPGGPAPPDQPPGTRRRSTAGGWRSIGGSPVGSAGPTTWSSSATSTARSTPGRRPPEAGRPRGLVLPLLLPGRSKAGSRRRRTSSSRSGGIRAGSRAGPAGFLAGRGCKSRVSGR